MMTDERCANSVLLVACNKVSAPETRPEGLHENLALGRPGSRTLERQVPSPWYNIIQFRANAPLKVIKLLGDRTLRPFARLRQSVPATAGRRGSRPTVRCNVRFAHVP